MEKSEVQLLAFQIIAYAGDAYDHFHTAVDMASEGDFGKASEEISLGDESLTLAHQSQTNLLQNEVNNEEIPFSVILVHSQDHLMSAIMYERTAKQMIEMYKKINREG